MTLGEFRKLTAGVPDELEIEIVGTDGAEGFEYTIYESLASLAVLRDTVYVSSDPIPPVPHAGN